MEKDIEVTTCNDGVEAPGRDVEGATTYEKTRDVAQRESNDAEIQSAGADTKQKNEDEPSLGSPPVYLKAFYCPLTGNLLEDPVVAPDGITYSRAALEQRNDDMSKVYHNRSLKTIMDEIIESHTSSKLKRLGRNVRQLITLTDYHQRPLPEGFYCPITLGLIHVPVIDPEGYSYEKIAIENWIRCNAMSPVTRQPLTLDDLYPNKTLATLMAEEKGKSDDLVHPIFKQWEEEPLPSIPDLEVAQSGISAFPTTPEELEAANRRRRIRRYNRCHVWFVVLAVIGVLAYLVPVVSTVLLVLVLAGVAIVAGYSSSSERFRGESQHGPRQSITPTTTGAPSGDAAPSGTAVHTV